MNRILVLCIGNICRSPLAAAELSRQLPGRQVWSAGLQALVGQPADPLSQQIALEQGLDLSAHRAQQLVPWMCQAVDVVFVMENMHIAMLHAQVPTVRGKVYRLGHFGNFEIADPYRQPREAFEASWGAISRGVADWAPRLRRLG